MTMKVFCDIINYFIFYLAFIINILLYQRIKTARVDPPTQDLNPGCKPIP